MARFLLVEDNPANLELLRFTLSAFGHTTLCAVDGLAGLNLARAAVPDIILCDLRMPKLDGFALLKEIRLDPRLKDTAYSMPGDREDALQAGFDGYFTKPIMPRTIVHDLEKILAAGPRARPAPEDRPGS
jgi:CheY-like chemotaxis protein